MPSASQLYSGSFLNAADLQPLGKRFTALIHQASVEIVGQDQKKMLGLSLVNKQGQPWPKKCLLNKTNTMNLVSAYGDDFTYWPGKGIVIWSENTMFQGRVMPGIKLMADGAGSGMATPQSATAVADLPAVIAAPAPEDGGLIDDEIPF